MGALGDLVWKLRRERGLKQADLAALAGLTQGMISHIETGRKLPGFRTLVRLARALSVPVSELVQALEEDLEEVNAQTAQGGRPSGSTSLTFLDLLKELADRSVELDWRDDYLTIWPEEALTDLRDALNAHLLELAFQVYRFGRPVNARELLERYLSGAPAQEPPKVSTPNNSEASDGMTLKDLLMILRERGAVLVLRNGEAGVNPPQAADGLQDALRAHMPVLTCLLKHFSWPMPAGKLLTLYLTKPSPCLEAPSEDARPSGD